MAELNLKQITDKLNSEFAMMGAKKMLIVEDVDSKEFLTGLFHVMYDELPVPKSKKKK